MINLYTLEYEHGDYSCFLEKYNHIDNTFWRRYYNWQKINLDTYETVKFEICRSDTGKKNFKMDIYKTGTDIIILSEKAVNVLKDILDKTGQIVPIDVGSKRKKFFGFFPNKSVYSLDVVDLDKSEYESFSNQNFIGKSFEKLVLKSNYPKDDYLFTIKDVTMKVFVTEKFKKLVEENNLKAFAFKPFLDISE